MKTKKYLFIVILLFCFNFYNHSQNRILLSKARIHIGNGEVINQGLVGVEGENIVLVKNALTYTYNPNDWDTIIDLKGQELYPGFFALSSTLGLSEINAVRASRDYNEIGEYNPNMRSLTSYNTDSDILATVKANGVLLVQSTPSGGVISGTSSIMKAEAWNWEDARIKEDDGIHLNWPRTVVGGGWWASPSPKKDNKEYSKQLKEVLNFFDEAQAYSVKHHKFDSRFEAMNDLFLGNKRLYIHAQYLRELTDIIDFKYNSKIKHIVIVGAYDAYKVAGQLKDAGISIILRGTHSLPINEDDAVDLPYRLPFLLQEAGLLFSIQNTGSMQLINERNIPFLAGTARAYGLTTEEAIAMVSLNAAKIVGVDNVQGSIEVGKKATLFTSAGDALDMKTNQLTMGMINGSFIQLSNHQTDLYLKYKSKYESQRKDAE